MIVVTLAVDRHNGEYCRHGLEGLVRGVPREYLKQEDVDGHDYYAGEVDAELQPAASKRDHQKTENIEQNLENHLILVELIFIAAHDIPSCCEDYVYRIHDCKSDFKQEKVFLEILKEALLKKFLYGFVFEAQRKRIPLKKTLKVW